MPRPHPELLTLKEAFPEFYDRVERLLFREVAEGLATDSRPQTAQSSEYPVSHLPSWRSYSIVQESVIGTGSKGDGTRTVKPPGKPVIPATTFYALGILAGILGKDPRLMRRDWARWSKGKVFPSLDEFLSVYEGLCAMGWDDSLYSKSAAMAELHRFATRHIAARDEQIMRKVAPFLRVAATTLVESARLVSVNPNKALPFVLKLFFTDVLKREEFRLTPDALDLIARAFETLISETGEESRNRKAKRLAAQARIVMDEEREK